ncbi:MAG TPA: PqqD family peptide modification chaperone [Candidatus Binatia bacterium]|nr:PqqD family peptide modification chaperone [Candidatus Binatia bacterium]
MKAAALADDAFPQLTPWCVIRPQEDRYLIYNTRSDELHLVPHAGFLVYSLCDGAHSVRDIAAHLANRMDGEVFMNVQSRVREYLSGLIARGLVNVDNA